MVVDLKAYEKLRFYQDICVIRRQVFILTERFGHKHLRLVSQMRDAARSAKQNIREGYRKGTIGEFIHSIRISQGSLEELSGDMEDCLADGIISKTEHEEFHKLYLSAMYMSSRYISSMNQPINRKSWKIPATSIGKKL
jgi:four helix bundle protein